MSARIKRKKWQAWQDLNLQPLVLETSALPIELQTYPIILTGLFMGRMAPAMLAVFLVFDSARVRPTILSRVVIPTTAFGAFQFNLLSRHDRPNLNNEKRFRHESRQAAELELMTRLELVTSSLPRTRSTN